MKDINLAKAKARLSELVDQAAAGETVRILKRGKPVAQITAVTPPKRGQIDFEALKRLRDSMPMQKESAGDFIRRMRDDSRY
jgi:prevent-host-death family protein